MEHYSALPNPTITIYYGIAQYPIKFEVQIFLQSVAGTMQIANTSMATQCLINAGNISMSKRVPPQETPNEN